VGGLSARRSQLSPRSPKEFRTIYAPSRRDRARARVADVDQCFKSLVLL